MVQELLDKSLMSWSDWGDPGGNNAQWAPNLAQQTVWARTYAPAIAGTPINMSFHVLDPAKPFELCYHIDRTIAAPTIVYASRRLHYPTGLTVVTTPNLHATQPDSVNRPNIWEVTSMSTFTQQQQQQQEQHVNDADGEVGCVRMRVKVST